MKKVNNKLEQNIIIILYATKRIINIFLGPFLTAFFIKSSSESVVALSKYYILSYIAMILTCYFVAKITKNKFRIGLFRIGVILNFIYVLNILILKENIIQHLTLMAILYGASSAAYWFPCNMFTINKISNSDRTDYTVKSRLASSLVGILCPILLGSIITVTNYILTAVIILFISLLQIILSFILTPDIDTNLPKFDIKSTWNKIKNNIQVRNCLLSEFFVGMNINDGALEIVMTILIFNSFKTDLNLGIITSIVTVLTMIVVKLYGEKYKNKDDKRIVLISSIIPMLSLLLLLFIRTNVTMILYNFCYVIFATLLTIAKEIRLYNLSNSTIIDKTIQSEFLAIREIYLNSGRIFSYAILLIAKLFNLEILLNVVMIILTLSIIATGLHIRKTDKFETNSK